MIEEAGDDYAAYILAISTIAVKGCIDEIVRGLHEREKRNPDYISADAKYTLDYGKELKKEFEKKLGTDIINAGQEQILEAAEAMKEVDAEVFYYFKGLLGVPVAQSMHPAGMIVSPINLKEHYGTMQKSGMQILQIDMDDVHEVGLAKFDILGLKNIQIVDDTVELLGIDYPRAHQIDWNDENVWNDMLKSSVGIFQFESNFAHDSLRKFKPKSIADMSLVTAAIRPGGASYRDELFKKNQYKNPSKMIDNLLSESYGRIIYQEQVSAFLQQICGLSGSEADNLRRAIGRKDKDRLEKALPQVIKGYCEKSDQPREIAEGEVKQYIQVLEDASYYLFGKNHSYAYCMIGYLCAYYRYYHTPQFIVAFLNNAANDDDIVDGFKLATIYGYNIEPPRFRYAKSNYSYDGDKAIYKGLSSVKWLNEAATEYLYSLKDVQFDSFADLLHYIYNDPNRNVDSRKMEILIQINFFEEFGGNKKLMNIYKMAGKLLGKKQFNRVSLPVDEEWLLKYATSATEKTIFVEKGFKTTKDLELRPEKFGRGEKKLWEERNTVEVTYYNIDCTDTNEPVEPRMLTMLRDHEHKLDNEFYAIREQMQIDKEYFGYINMKYGNLNANYCYVQAIDTRFSPRATLYSLGLGKELSYKVNKKTFADEPFKVGDVIMVVNYEDKPRWIMGEDGKFKKNPDGSTEEWLTSYQVLSPEEWAKISGEKMEPTTSNSSSEYDRYLIYDIESSGFKGSNSDILEIGYIVAKKGDDGLLEETKRGEFLVQTNMPVNNTFIHGLTAEMCNSTGITPQQCLDIMAEYFTDSKTLVLGYNQIKFDNPFVASYAARHRDSYPMVNDNLDIMYAVKDVMNVKKGFKLENAIAYFGLSGREQAHRGLSDVLDSLNVYNAMIKRGIDVDSYIKKNG